MKGDPERAGAVVFRCALFAVIGFGWFLLPAQWTPDFLATPLLLKPRAIGRYATSDAYLPSLEIPQPSQRLLDALSEVPVSDGIVFAGSADDPSFILAYYTVSHLGWPRKIGLLDCSKANQDDGLFYPDDRPDDRKEQMRWLLFYRRRPPVELEPSSLAIGENLRLVAIKELKAWTSYCSR